MSPGKVRNMCLLPDGLLMWPVVISPRRLATTFGAFQPCTAVVVAICPGGLAVPLRGWSATGSGIQPPPTPCGVRPG